MFGKLSIRKKLIIFILGGCLIPYLAGSLFIKSRTEKWLYNNYVDNTRNILIQNAMHVDDTILKSSKSLTDMIVSDERVQKPDNSINSYVNYDKTNFKRKNSKLESDIVAYFRSIKESHDIVTLISVGTEYGGYIEYPSFNPSAPYDPRTREWYKEASKLSTTYVSEPYMTKVTKDLVISINRTIMADNKKIGVVSLGISLDNIMDSINRQRFSSSGYIDILSPENVFINSPGNKDWLLKSVSGLKLEGYSNLDSLNGKSFETTINGAEKICCVYISPNSGWKFVSVSDKSDVLKQSRIVLNLLFLVYLVTLVMMLALILLLSNYITKPILNI
jgi:methyl-accepting chemotaxis protein